MPPEIDEEVRALRRDHDQLCEVAFLGNSGSGKTVVVALLVDCMTTYWSDGNQKACPVIIKGEKRINDAIGDLMNLKYPSATKKGDPPTIIKINGSREPSNNGNIILHDIPGEDFVQKIADNEDDVVSMLNLIRSEGQEHLIFAKKYVIAVDCSEMDTWKIDSGRLAAALVRIMNVRKYVYERDLKIDVPVAVLITKTDTLEGDMQHQSVEEILKRYQRLLNSLNLSCNMQNIDYFKSYMETEQVNNIDQLAADDRKLGSGNRMIKDPFTYNTAEYSRMVSWILNEWN